MSFLPMVAFIAILYFLLIRPQQKRTKQHQALIAAIKKGDKVITSCGIIASVSKVANDQEVILEIADGVHCRFVKTSVANVIAGDSSPAANKPSQASVAGDAPVPTNKKVEAISDKSQEAIEPVVKQEGTERSGGARRQASRGASQTKKK